ncbi:putative integral membrane protein [Rosellinia necatrix]|uniref:Putative integral membrane protein n=1 Tax=Rosellinia necatrix TaxID=77044 RepID=A0A1W2TN69_ROSNE|nr:putative integral membrane protein [Rosellinia necatrix]
MITFRSDGANVNASANDNSPLIYVPAWMFLFICPVVVGARIWTSKKSGGLRADDYTILVSLVFALVTDIIILWGCSNGYGKHTETVPDSQKRGAFLSIYILQTTYKISISLTKMSIVLLYLRIFGGVQWCKRACYILLAVIVLYSIALIIASICECIPVIAVFDKSVASKKCINNGPFRFASTAFSIATDVVIILIPIPLIRSLQIPREKKILLIFGFGLGIFVIITSILRSTTINTQQSSRDPLYDVSSTMWMIIEMSVAIICACIPQIRLLIVNVASKLVPRGRESSDTLTPLEPWVCRKAGHEEEGGWAKVEYPYNIELTTTCKHEADSEMLLMRNGEGSSGEIRVTVTLDYEVQYLNGQITLPLLKPGSVS